MQFPNDMRRTLKPAVGATQTKALLVNNAGQILVQGTAAYGTFVLLTPIATTTTSLARTASDVPEPAEMIATVTGTGILVRRRSRSTKS